MAAKVNMMKLLQEIRGFAAITNRRPPPRFPGLLLMQMRDRRAQDKLSPRRLNITIDTQRGVEAPNPVRIHHR
jgi:hypothetical protein